MVYSLNMKSMRIGALFLAVTLGIALLGCATQSAPDQVVREREQRAYDRFKAQHSVSGKSDMEQPGIYFYRGSFHVVLSLSDAGTDGAPEWAAEKLLVSMYGYQVMDQRLVSRDEFASLVLDFSIKDIREDQFTTTVRTAIPEGKIRRFFDDYRD